MLGKAQAAGMPFPSNEDKYSGWEWCYRKLDVSALKQALPREAFQAAALHVFISQVYQTSEPAKADGALLDDAPGHLRATVAWLKYELAKAKGDAALMKEARERVAKDHEEVLWRLDEADKGRGLLTRLSPKK